ncbi:MAG: hypothetical protein JWO51_1926 [Rhodospirillales bacterium]|nr:hypothetical protein [Rhodospirillales bacterium]
MRLTAGFLVLSLAVAGTALAQIQTPSQPDIDRAPPDKIGPPLEQHPVPQTGTAEPLSKELSRTNGVVRPPASVDPGMSQTPPDPGAQSMPVIKPPTPDAGVAPK